MNSYVYKQNTGVLSKNQTILKKAIGYYQLFQIGEKLTYCYSKCGEFYRFVFSLHKGIIKISPSTSDYDYLTYLSSDSVYKEDGSIYLDLSYNINGVFYFDFKIKKNQTIMITYGNISEVLELK